MKNLYIWFPCSEERRKFFLELLELGPSTDWYLNTEFLLHEERHKKRRYRNNRREEFNITLAC